MTTVAITGVSGLVGSRVLARLRDVTSVDRIVGIDIRPPTGLDTSGLAFREADVTDPGEIDKALEGADVVVHLAFQLDPMRDEDRMREINVEGSRNVIEGTARAGAGKLVYASSAAVYGAHPDNDVPLTEDSPLRANPDFPYPEHKQAVEEYLAGWIPKHPDVTVTLLRPAMVVGSDMDNFIVRAMQGPRLLAVSGHRPPFQFLHVDDLADAVVHAIEHDLPGAYNVGAEGWLSFDEVAAILGRKVLEIPEEVAFTITERTYDLGIGEAPAGLIHYQMHPWVVAVDKLVATGWRPAHSNRDAVALLAAEHGDRLALGHYVTSRSTVRRATVVALGAAGGLLALGVLSRRGRHDE